MSKLTDTFLIKEAAPTRPVQRRPLERQQSQAMRLIQAAFAQASEALSKGDNAGAVSRLRKAAGEFDQLMMRTEQEISR